jgi:glycerol-3-phosphate dehydrogenase
MMEWRSNTKQALTEGTFDLLVIGGGATGAGIALDAAARGLKVALLEREDFSQGTSSRSTKLLHGGVRYLELAVKKLDYSQFHLVQSALHERHTLLRIAPHLSRAFPLVTPLYRFWELPYYYIGLKLYDLIAGRYRIGSSSVQSRQQTLDAIPGLRPARLRGSVQYFDGQFDDSRMVIAILRKAAEHGAQLLNHAQVTDLLKSEGRVSGAVARDLTTGDEFQVNARTVINATGPFADAIRKLDDPATPDLLTVSSGTHIVLNGSFMPHGKGMLIPRTDDGRVLFLLPWLGHTLVGTTDNPALVQENPHAPEEDIDYLLEYVTRYLEQPVDRSDVLAAWTGFRPLLKPSSGKSTAQITRDHYLGDSPSGLITITGGKWTTYRQMAQDAVDHAVKAGALQPVRPCTTEQIILTGGEDFDPQGAARLVESFGLPGDVAEHLHHAYGSQAQYLVEMARAESLEARLHPEQPFLEAEVVFAVRFEFAVTADDVLSRRLRLGFLDQAAYDACLPRVRELVAAQLSSPDQAVS